MEDNNVENVLASSGGMGFFNNRTISMIPQSANHRVIDANMPAINPRKKILKEGFQKDIRDVDMSSLRANEPDYILKERFGTAAKDAVDVSISLIAILIVCIVAYWIFVKIYVKCGKFQWIERTNY